MNIQKISFTPKLQHFNRQNVQQKNNENTIQTNNYNPIAYRDFNINFGARLFRTPQDFYSQEFNKKNMPESMKKYLNQDYSDRENIPPAQMMQIVFEDLDYASNFEEVKELYPDEPLFTNLHEVKTFQNRKGLLEEINLFKEEGIPLFKDGSDNLGMYILKKIYQEGKTLKEINKDFKNDHSEEYEGLSPIDHSVTSAYGISFPKRDFWHSFIATREDFPYVYKPRKIESPRTQQNTYNTTEDKTKAESPRKRTRVPKDHEIKDITDILFDNIANKEKTKKELEKKYKKDDEKITFIQKYMGPIMSITLERIHASEELKYFFESNKNSDENLQEKMKKYWKHNPALREKQSEIMSDTIKLFFELYGVDGENEEFKELLNYANSIKPEREERQRIHDLMQEEYEAALGLHEEENDLRKTPVEQNNQKPTIHNAKTEEELKEEEIDSFITVFANFTTAFMKNPKKYDEKEFRNLERKYFLLKLKDSLPKSFLNLYIRETQKYKEFTPEFFISRVIHENKIPNLKPEFLETEDNITQKINKFHVKILRKYFAEFNALEQAKVNTYYFEGIIPKYDIYQLNSIFHLKNDNEYRDKQLLEKYESTYQKLRKPLNNKEINQILAFTMNFIKNYNSNNSTNVISESSKQNIIYFQKALYHNRVKTMMRSLIKTYIEKYGGAQRNLIDSNVPEKIKLMQMEYSLDMYIAFIIDDFNKQISEKFKYPSNMTFKEILDFIERY